MSEDVYTDQAIFDAIAAATDHNDDGIFVDVQKFINTFNNHRDRKLCASLDVAHPSWERLTSVIRPMIESVCSDGNSNAARLTKEVADALIAAGISGFAQAPPDQFMDDYKRDTTNAMAARILELEALLSAAQKPSDPLAGLVERLDRLCLTSTEDGRRFVLATESAKNIVGIVREWLRTSPAQTPPSED